MLPYDATAASLFTPYVDEHVYLIPEDTVTSGACAELARLVYILFEKEPTEHARLVAALRVGGYELVKAFSKNTTQAMAVSHIKSGKLIVVFRGTEIRWWDITTILTVIPSKWPHGGFTHTGFQNALNKVWGEICNVCGDRLNTAIFTGHSLGAAIATLAANDIKHKASAHLPEPKLITFGSPAVGDAAFAASSTGYLVKRYVNCCDLVINVPPEIAGFVHVGEALYFNSKGKLDASSPAILKMDRYLARAYFLARYFFDKSSVKVRDLADHAPTNYVRLF